MNDLCNIITNQRYDLVLKEEEKKEEILQRFSFFSDFLFLLQIIVGYILTPRIKKQRILIVFYSF